MYSHSEQLVTGGGVCIRQGLYSRSEQLSTATDGGVCIRQGMYTVQLRLTAVNSYRQRSLHSSRYVQSQSAAMYRRRSLHSSRYVHSKLTAVNVYRVQINEFRGGVETKSNVKRPWPGGGGLVGILASSLKKTQKTLPRKCFCVFLGVKR